MAERLPSLNRTRLSTLAAIVLLAFSLLRLIELPTIRIEMDLLGLLLRLDLSTPFVFLTLTATLVVAGTDWLIRGHPHVAGTSLTLEHWVIPGLAALGLGVILSRIPGGAALLIGLPLADLLLVLVLAAEFIVVDRADPRFDWASLLIRVLGYLLLTGVLFAITATDLRAIFAVPFVFLASSAMAWRLLVMEEPVATARLDSVLIGLVLAQVAWGLHYWPIAPLRESLLLALVAYLAEGLARMLRQGELSRRRVLEYGLVAAFCLGALTVLT
jgi:hypothetical protein